MNTRLRTTRFAVAAIIVGGSCLLGQQPGGVTARAQPENYAAHATAGGRTYAASLVPADQVKHIFAADISRKYLVFEVACYPENGASVDIHPDAFVVLGRDKDMVRPADAMTVAARMEHKSEPKLPSGSEQVYTEASVGHESGTDPYTGRRVHGTYESVGAGVGHGPDQGRSSIPPDWGQDMEALQRQLEDRGLPSGKFDRPVAGYLYYPLALVKKPAGKDGYQLKYDGDAAERAVLTFPPKSR